MISFIIGFIVSAPVFAYLGYRYGSKAVAEAVTLKADIDKKV